MGIMGQSRRYNLDGVACFDSQQGSYTQLFRRGAIEGVWPISKPESKYIWGPSVEQVTCSVLKNYLSFLSDLRLMPPASIFMTLLNMDSHEIVFADEHISNPGPRMEWEPPFPSREAVLPLPETTITDFSAEVRPIVKPMLEVLYQISGWLHSTL